MARPESIALGGYFPSPAALLPSLASLVSFEPQDEVHVLVDPCAGDGAAITALRRHWFLRPDKDAVIHAVELEEQRAKDLRQQLRLYGSSNSDVSLHCDAFHVDITAREGASVLFLNP